MDNPVKDKNYNLISSLYHLAHGSENARRYASDAQADNDEEVKKLFEELQRVYNEYSQEVAKLVKERL